MNALNSHHQLFLIAHTTASMLCRFRMTPSKAPNTGKYCPIPNIFRTLSCVLWKYGSHSLIHTVNVIIIIIIINTELQVAQQHLTWREENQRLQVGILGFINVKLTDSTDIVLQSCHCANDPLYPFTRHLLYKPHN